MEKVWILEDTRNYREELEKAVVDCGFEPVSFNARNPFLRAYFDANKSNVAGMILDNQVPYFDEPRERPRENVGIGIVRELDRKGLLEGINVALYTSSEMNAKIEEVCEMGVLYRQKAIGVGCEWVGDFLGKK